VLANAANDVASLTITAPGQTVTYADASGFVVNGLQGSTIALSAAGAITQGLGAGNAIVGTSLSVTDSAGGVLLNNAANDVTTISIVATGQTVGYTDATGFSVNGIQAAAITLVAAGAISQVAGAAAAVTGGSLVVTDTVGGVVLDNAANDVASISITATGQTVTYNDKTGFVVNGLQAATITLTAAGAVTQGAGAANAVGGGTLAVTDTAGGVVLDNAANDLASISITATGQTVTYTDATALFVTGITGAAITLATGGALAQTGPIAGTSLSVNTAAGGVSLTNAANDVTSLSVTAAGQPVAYTDKTGFVVNGIQGSAVTLVAAGPITQGNGAASAILVSGGSLSVTNTVGGVVLGNAANDAASISISAPAQAVTYADASGFVVNGIQGSAITLTAAGVVTQAAGTAAAILGASLVVTDTAGSVTLTNTANDVGSLAVAAASQVVSYTDATGFVVNGISGTAITLAATGAMTQGATAADRIAGTWLLVRNGGGPVTLDNVANDVASLAVFAAANQPVTYFDATGFVVNGITGSSVQLNAHGALTQGGTADCEIVAASLVVTDTSGGVVLGHAANDVVSLSILAGGQTVAYNDATGFAVNGLQGATITLTAAGAITQSAGAISGGALVITNAAGGVVLGSTANDIASLAVAAVGQVVTYTDASGFVVNGIQGSAISLAGGGAITQGSTPADAIAGSSLTVANAAGGVVLDNAANDVASISIVAAGQTVTYTDASAISVTGLTGDAIRLKANGLITQTGAIVATSLAIVDTGGAVTLTNPVNDVGSLSVAAAGQPVAYTDRTGFTVSGIQAATIVLTGAGAITQATGAAAAILGTALTITNGTGGVVLGNAANDVASVSVSAAGQIVTYVDASGFVVNGIQGAAITLTGAGAITQGSGAGNAITATGGSLTVVDSAGGVVLDNAANDVASLTITAPGQTVTYADASGFVVNGLQGSTIALSAAGAITQGTSAGNAIIGTVLSVTDTAGGVVLDNAANDVQSLAIANPGRAIAFTDASGIVVAGLSGSSIVLAAGGDVVQGAGNAAAITGTSLSVTNTAGVVVLQNAANDVASLAIANGSRTVAYTDATGYAVAGITGGPIYLAAAGTVTQTAPITGSTLAFTNTAGSVTLDHAANDLASVSILAGNRAVTYADKSGFAIFGNGPVGLTGSAIKLLAGGDVVQSAAITGTSLAVTTTAGAVTLTNAANDVASVSIANASRSVAYTDATGFDVAGIAGSTITLRAGGAVTQGAAASNAITGTALSASTTAGGIVLGNAANDVATLAVAAAGGPVGFTDKNGVSVAGISGGAVTLAAGGDVTQTAAITGSSLTVTTTAGVVNLPNAANDVAALSVANASRTVTFTDATGFDVAGIAGGTITLQASGGVTQSKAITGSSLTITNTAGSVALGDAANDVATVAIANAGRTVSYVDANGFTIAGLSGSTITLAAGGDVTQSAAITGTALSVTSTGGAVTLGNAGNSLASVAISNASRTVSFTDSTGVDIAGLTGSSVSLVAGGAVTQSAPIIADTFSLSATGGGATLTSAGNTIGVLAASLPTAGAALNVRNGTTLAISQAIAAGPVTIAAAGNLRIGPAATPTPLLQSGSTVNLAGVTGQVILENGGRIVAPGGVTLPAGQSIQIPVVGGDGGVSLASAISQANSLKMPTSFLAANGTVINLTRALPSIQAPITFAGSGVSIIGSSVAPIGFQLTAAAARSTISGITFRNFSTAAIQLNGVQNVLVSGVTIVSSGIGVAATGNLAGTRVTGSTFTNNAIGARLTAASNFAFGTIGNGNRLTGTAAGTGLVVSGASTGTTARANTFVGYGYGVQITAATGVAIGGTAAGAANTVSSAAKAGVFASGVCTASSVVRTVFTNTKTTYATGGARGLTVVR
jgi:hypothetical protein